MNAVTKTRKQVTKERQERFDMENARLLLAPSKAFHKQKTPYGTHGKGCNAVK